MTKPVKKDFDAVVVGSGPNGLAAAITLQSAGLSVLILEAKENLGGGVHTASLTLPGFLHDVCSAVYPMAAVSPFINSLPLSDHGLQWIYPSIDAAHPFDDGTAAILKNSVDDTAFSLGKDSSVYSELVRPLLQDWPRIAGEILSPLHIPKHPIALGRFGIKALPPADFLVRRFKGRAARGLWAGMAAHAVQPFSNLATSAIGLVMLLTAHRKGWPIVRGGAANLTNALSAYFLSLGGKIETGHEVKSLNQLPGAQAVLFDLSPRQLLGIAGQSFSHFYRWQLNRYQYGMGVFKMDWALDEPVPFTATAARTAATVHIGNSYEEIAAAESQTAAGRSPEKPFVLFSQPSLFDDSRAPIRKHTAWAYCHTALGATNDMSSAIENQIERFAPGFKDRILARHTMNTRDLELYNANYIGGDIGGGRMDIGQLFTRPALRYSPYRTSGKGLYICSASTPPGGAVHGMCGYHAAKRALRDIFQIRLPQIQTL